MFAFDDTFQINSPNYFGEEDNVYEAIHYLENEFLSLKFCTDKESTDINLNLDCGGDNLKNIPLFDFKQSSKNVACYFTNFNLANAGCDDFKLKLDYNYKNKNKNFQRDFVKQKQSKLINYILGSDENQLSDTDLSYYLIVNNDVENIYSKKSLKVYNMLKTKRDNANKCWPESSCSIVDSTLILRNLKIAGYDSSSRLIEDGKTYIENNILSNQNNPLAFSINFVKNMPLNETINCDVKIDGGSPVNYVFSPVHYLNNTNITSVNATNSTTNSTNNSSNNSTYVFPFEIVNSFSIEKSMSSSLEFSCSSNFDSATFILYGLNNTIRKSEVYTNTDSFVYNIENFACIGNSNICDFSSSVSTLITYPNSLSNYNLIQNYLDSNFVIQDTEKYLNLPDEYENSGKYLYFIQDANLLDHLKYKQNNDGSWGTSSKYDRIIQTSWDVLGLQKSNSNSEYVKDGKKWIYYNEPESGWGSIEKNSLAYLAIKEQIKPYLKINIISQIKDEYKFEIENPTIYKLKNIKVVFSKQINDYLSYTQDLGDLEGEGKINFTVKLKNNFFGKLTGNIKISGVDGKNNLIEFVNAPINIQGPLPFEIIPKNHSVSADNLNVVLDLKYILDNFSSKCSLINPFNQVKQDIDLNKDVITISLLDTDLKTGNFQTSLDCIYNSNKFSVPIDFNVSVSEKSFSLNDYEKSITDFQDFSIYLTSLVNDKQIVSIKILGDLNGVVKPTEADKIIAGNDNREIFFSVVNDTLLSNLSSTLNSEILITSDTGYSKKIPLYVQLEPIKSENSSHWILYTILSFLVFSFIIFLIRRYRQLHQDDNVVNNNSDDQIYMDDIDF